MNRRDRDDFKVIATVLAFLAICVGCVWYFAGGGAEYFAGVQRRGNQVAGPRQIARFGGGPFINKQTEYFETDSGELKVSYTVSSTRGGQLTMNVENRNGVAESVCVMAKQNGSNRVRVEPGKYFLRVIADRCDWSATVFED